MSIKLKKIAGFLLLFFLLENFIICYIKVHFKYVSLILFSFDPMTAAIRVTEHVSIFSFKTSCSTLANIKFWICFNVTPMLACKISF